MSSVKPKDHAALATGYARDVIAGRIPAGKRVIQAAQRHLDDLARAEKDKEYPFYFSSEHGARVCRFIEKLPHTKGQWAARGERIDLGAWQCFIVVVLFGWLRKSDGKRRFRVAYFEIPRKNGKSLLMAGIGLYMLTADGEHGAEVYSGATTEKQAWEVFRPARLMLLKNSEFCAALGAEVLAKALAVVRKGSRFEPLIGNPGDGASPSCAIVDEFHEHDTPALYDTMETGMGSREQPLMLAITTAGYNTSGPCYEKRDEAIKVLDGIFENDQLFSVIYSIDENDDWTDPKSLIKANPNYGVSVDPEFLLAQQRAAVLNPVQQNKFRTKHLNVWCTASVAWMNANLWTLAADPMLTMDELIGESCWISVDLASKVDLAAEQILFRKVINALPHYYLFGRYWLPENTIEAPGRNQAIYRKWVISEHLTPTSGATIDYDAIAEQVIADMKHTQAREFVFDPFNATHLSQMVGEALGGFVPVVEFHQRPWNFALPMDEITAALTDGRFHHDGNPVTGWCMSNTVAKRTKKDMFSPTKERADQKIDGAVAAIMCVARAISTDPVEDFTSFFASPVGA